MSDYAHGIEGPTTKVLQFRLMVTQPPPQIANFIVHYRVRSQILNDRRYNKFERIDYFRLN